MEEAQDTHTKKSGNPMMMLAAVGVLAVAGIGYFLFSSDQSEPTTDTMVAASPVPTAMVAGAESMALSDAMDTDGIEIVEVEAGSFYYKPNEIRVKKGDKVKIVMKSVDMMHDLHIEELGVKLPITKSGETGTVEFVAEKVGTFEYYCSVGSHRKMGQVGKLIVEE